MVERHIALLEETARRKVDFVAYGETTLTPLSPRWIIDEESRCSAKIDVYFENSMPNRVKNIHRVQDSKMLI